MDLSIVFMPVVTLFTGQLIVLDLARFRFARKKLYKIVALEFILQVLLSAAILLVYGYEAYVLSFFFCMELPAILTLFYASRRRDFRDLFTILITVFLSLSFSIPSMWIAQYIGGSYWWYNLIRIGLFLVIFYLLHKHVRQRYIQIQEDLEHGWGIFCILPLIACFSMYSQYLNYSRNHSFSSVMANCAMIILMMGTIFAVFNYVLKQLHEKYLLQEKSRILEMQNRAQLAQFEQQREAAEKLNRRWHDLHHSVQKLIELLEDGEVETALGHLKEQRGAEQVINESYCMHPAVNSMLCLWAARSRKAGIRMELGVDLPEALSIEPMELSALFANAIENAYEGCMRLPENEERYIKVEAHWKNRRLAIGITNSCLTDIPFDGDLPVSMKQNGGIGTRSMVYTVERFLGSYYFEAKKGVFTARFLLYIPKDLGAK